MHRSIVAERSVIRQVPVSAVFRTTSTTMADRAEAQVGILEAPLTTLHSSVKRISCKIGGVQPRVSPLHSASATNSLEIPSTRFGPLHGQVCSTSIPLPSPAHTANPTTSTAI